MSKRQDIDGILRDWPFEPGVISARLVPASGGREVLQMRVEMGVLQMELDGRPDGERPEGAETYLDHLLAQATHRDEDFEMSSDECMELDREFVQFYHRRICCLALRDFCRAVTDADHTLAMMDFIREHAPDDRWLVSHEQYRPFVLFHRTQAAAMCALKDHGPEKAVDEVARGLDQIREVFASMDAEDEFETDELVAHLREMKDSLREEYQLGPTLNEQLAEAIMQEQYERAARLRDEINRRTGET